MLKNAAVLAHALQGRRKATGIVTQLLLFGSAD
jgi:hypothetical protein